MRFLAHRRQQALEFLQPFSGRARGEHLRPHLVHGGIQPRRIFSRQSLAQGRRLLQHRKSLLVLADRALDVFELRQIFFKLEVAGGDVRADATKLDGPLLAFTGNV